MATNPAGSGFSYIDLVLYSQFITETHAQRNVQLILAIVYSFIFPGSPIIFSPPTDQLEINNGSNAIFMCSALAFPRHQVFWTFTGDSEFEIPVLSTEDGMDTPKYLSLIHI